VHNILLYAYYGGDYIGKDVTIDPANKNAFAGYGYPKSANSRTGPSRKAPSASTRRFGRTRTMEH
jgi:hypothetical protein